MYLENMENLTYLRSLKCEQLNVLADEIREAIITRCSKIGGHIGSNLGVVELTIALHYVFDSPKDKLVFDVSHQSYTHKILTGRKDNFMDEDRYNEVSGFSAPCESEHDIFKIGHTSTSIGLAVGLAKARDLKGTDEKIIAIIGDGSLSGGLAYEGLNVAGELDSNLLIIVNDNQMSIAEDHGGLYKNLARLRETKGKCESNFFKDLNLDYYYLDKGNDIESLVAMLNELKNVTRPTVLHVNTNKGNGYSFSNDDKEGWHYHFPFDKTTGERINFQPKSYLATTSNHLMERIRKDKELVVITSGAPQNLGFDKAKREEAGKQFLDVGIAEEIAVCVAGGIARNKGKVVYGVNSSFLQRAYDQLMQDIAINKLPVTILVFAGSVYADNNVTHCGVHDISMISNIPNVVYLAPTCKQEYLAMLDWSIDQNTYPVIIKVPFINEETNNEHSEDYSELNKYLVTKEGKDVAIIASGDMYALGREVAQNIDATLVNPRYLTGLDIQLLEKLKEEYKVVVTIEDGKLDGGFGEKIARYYGNSNLKVLNYGLKKEYIDRFDLERLLRRNHLTVQQIVQDIKEVL